MSWQAYVDYMCGNEGNLFTSSVILGYDGSVWGQSPSFPQLKAEEVDAILRYDEHGTLPPTELLVGGVKYMVIQGEASEVICGKKDSGGVTINKTNQSLIFGFYDHPVTLGQSKTVVERIGANVSSPNDYAIILKSQLISEQKQCFVENISKSSSREWIYQKNLGKISGDVISNVSYMWMNISTKCLTNTIGGIRRGGLVLDGPFFIKFMI
ncbi:hypothetical protein MKW92_051013 [Papaver armeniacum]|nr:hypothetical protein MKW92_051013 [Papaver armeniacum]